LSNLFINRNYIHITKGKEYYNKVVRSAIHCIYECHSRNHSLSRRYRQRVYRRKWQDSWL